MKITATIHTASPDNFLMEQHGIRSAIESYIACLERQTFSKSDFELVIVDAFWPDNRHIVHSVQHSYRVKYVPCVRDHWLKNKIVGIAAAKNSTLAFAEGELVVMFDDAELFPTHLLDCYWRHYQTGVCAHALHKRMRRVKTSDGQAAFPFQGDEYVNDHRLQHINSNRHLHNHGGWLFAGTSFALADALAMNGFNERLDGCKSLEDCEFGGRLGLLGRQFALDPDCFLWILDHKAVYADVLRTVITKENYGFIVANTRFGETRANYRPLRQDELDIIDEQTVRFRQMHIDRDLPETKEWIDYPAFSLADERERYVRKWHAGMYD